MFQFFVRAEDSGQPSLGTQVPVDVLILGPQDKAPVFERTSSKYFVSESAPVGKRLLHVDSIKTGIDLYIRLLLLLNCRNYIFANFLDIDIDVICLNFLQTMFQLILRFNCI